MVSFKEISKYRGFDYLHFALILVLVEDAL